MQCKKCGQELNNKTVIITGSFVKHSFLTSEIIDLTVECIYCGAKHFNYVNMDDLILERRQHHRGETNNETGIYQNRQHQKL